MKKSIILLMIFVGLYTTCYAEFTGEDSFTVKVSNPKAKWIELGIRNEDGVPPIYPEDGSYMISMYNTKDKSSGFLGNFDYSYNSKDPRSCKIEMAKTDNGTLYVHTYHKTNWILSDLSDKHLFLYVKVLAENGSQPIEIGSCNLHLIHYWNLLPVPAFWLRNIDFEGKNPAGMFELIFPQAPITEESITLKVI